MYKVEELEKNSENNKIWYFQTKYKLREFISKEYKKNIDLSLLNIIDKVIKTNGFIAIEFRAEIGSTGQYKPVMLSIQNDSIFNTNYQKMVITCRN